MKEVVCRSCNKMCVALDVKGIQNEIYLNNKRCAQVPPKLRKRKRVAYKTMGNYQHCPWCGGSHKNFRDATPEDQATRTVKYVLDRRAE